MATSQLPATRPILNPAPTSSQIRKPWRRRILLSFGLVITVGLGVLGWTQGHHLLALSAPSTDLLTYTVAPIDLRITATESGTLGSASSVNVLSDVEGQVAIISLVPQATAVSKGDVVVELDSSALKTRQVEQQIVVEKARAAHSQALQAEKVARSQAESDIKTAELLVEFAKLDLQKYKNGDFPQQKRIAESDIALAEEEFKRANDRLKYSEELKELGYLSESQYEADKLMVMRARVKRELANVSAQLLHQYTYTRMMRDLESKVSEAERSLERAQGLAQGSIDQAATNLKAQESALGLEQSRLAHLAEQISKCIMRAPQNGVVVYPVPEDDDLAHLFIKQGAIVRERQHVFSIPDTDILQVSVDVHEAMINQVKPGLTARIWIDVYPDVELTGEVQHVSSLPNDEDWRRSTVKFYETVVTLNEQGPHLRPGMSAKVEILIDELSDVLAAPVQAVVQRGQVGFCFVQESGQPQLQKVRLGKTNHDYVQLLSGLDQGQRIVLSPDMLGIPAETLQQDEVAQASTPAGQPEPTTAPETSEEEDPAIVGVETDYASILTGTTAAVGEAEYEVRVRDGTVIQREFEFVIRNGPSNETVDVVVNGVNIGSAKLDENGGFEAEWSTEDDTFPENFPDGVGTGTTVDIGGILNGTLVGDTP